MNDERREVAMKKWLMIIVGVMVYHFAFAETVTLINGAVIEGNILSNSTDGIHMQTDIGLVFASFDDIGNIYPEGLSNRYDDGFVSYNALEVLIENEEFYNNSVKMEWGKELALSLSFFARTTLYSELRLDNAKQTRRANFWFGRGYRKYQINKPLGALTFFLEIATLGTLLYMSIEQSYDRIWPMPVRVTLFGLSFGATAFTGFVYPGIYQNTFNKQLREMLLLDEELNDLSGESGVPDFTPSEFKVSVNLLNWRF